MWGHYYLGHQTTIELEFRKAPNHGLFVWNFVVVTKNSTGGILTVKAGLTMEAYGHFYNVTFKMLISSSPFTIKHTEKRKITI